MVPEQPTAGGLIERLDCWSSNFGLPSTTGKVVGQLLRSVGQNPYWLGWQDRIQMVAVFKSNAVGHNLALYKICYTTSAAPQIN